MWGALNAVGKATGLVASEVEQPPFPCAAPLRPLKDVDDIVTAKMMDDENFCAVMTLMESNWELISGYTDPEAAEGGDLRLFSTTQVGNYHLMKATLTIRNTTAADLISKVHSEKLEDRQKYSADCTSVSIPARFNLGATKKVYVQHIQYWAPPPVAGRDFCFLIGQRDLGDGNHIIYGCSIDYGELPEASSPVRGYCMWSWHLTQVGPDIFVTYVNCIDPRGWAPGFLFSWLKTTAAKEFIAVRAMMSGKETQVDKVQFDDAGISEAEVAAELKRQEAEKK